MGSPVEIQRKVYIDDSEFAIRATPGTVTVPNVGSIDWRDALLFADGVRQAANVAQVLEELAMADQDVKTCAKCGERLRDGIAVVEDEADPSRWRHVEGSPECPRR